MKPKPTARTVRAADVRATMHGRPAAAMPQTSPPVSAPAALAASSLPAGRGGILGQVAWLMARSPRHRHLFLADLEWLVYPPMRLEQCRLLRDQAGNPVAFASWALVNEAVEKRLQNGGRRLKPDEWRSGDRLWLIDVVAPESAVPKVVAELQKNVFGDRPVRTLMPVAKSVKPRLDA